MTIIRKSIALEPQDENTIQQVMSELGVSRSAAIRIIIRGWKYQHDRFAVTEKGRQVINGGQVLDAGQS